MVVIVVCGVGHLIMLRLIMATLSELDHLYYWDLVCAFRLFYPSSLVGGAWPDISRCGLWCWNLNENSGAYGVVGARPLVLLWDLMCVFRL